MPLNVIVVGAGVCDQPVAMLLQRFNPQHNITIVERSPTLRSTGQTNRLEEPSYPYPEEDGSVRRNQGALCE